MKKGVEFAISTMAIMVLIMIVVAVVVVIFINQTQKASSQFSNLTEESKIDVSKCRNIFLGRRCMASSDCSNGLKVVPGRFSDCGAGQVCCGPS